MKFCPECGTPIARENSRFCDHCGAPLVPTGSGSQIPVPYGYTARPREQKSAMIASLCSSFIPGLGQVYNGMTARGIALFAATLAGLAFLLLPGLIVWVYAIYDAYSMAGKMNAGEIPYVPTRALHMVLFAIGAIAVVIIIIIVVVMAVMAEIGPMMGQMNQVGNLGDIRGLGF